MMDEVNVWSMDKILIRPMREADYESAVAVWSTTDGIGLSDADSREGICRYLAHNPAMSLVAETGSELVGTLLCGHDGRRGYLHHLAVAKACRQRGVGRALVEEGVARLSREGITRCHIFVFPDNTQGLAFWNKMGFSPRRDIQLCSRNL